MTDMKQEGVFTVCKMNERAIVPTRGTPGSAGFDIYALEQGSIPAGTTGLIKTGIKMAISEGYYGQVCGRSGIALKHSVYPLGGVIDSDYRGEVCVILHNSGTAPFSYAPGDRVAQILILPIYSGTVQVRDTLDNTCRQEGGFGSTGK